MKQPASFYAGCVLRCTLLVAFSLAAQSVAARSSAAKAASSNPPVEDLGALQLKRGYPDLAKTTCEATLKNEPKNEEARKCLDSALAELEAREAGTQDRTLAQAESLLQLGKKAEALGAVEKIQAQIHRTELAARAIEIIKKAGRTTWLEDVKRPLSEAGVAWILDVVVGVAIIAISYWTLKAIRSLKRKQKKYESRYFRLRTHWRVTPVEDTTKVGTSSFVLSAYDSLKSNLSDSSNPILLLCRISKVAPVRNASL
jgi:hypothetical protein